MCKKWTAFLRLCGIIRNELLWIELWITCFCLATQDHIHIKQIMKRLLCVNVGLISFFVSELNLNITQ